MSWPDFISTLDRLANTNLFTLAGTEVNAVSIVTFLLIILVAVWVSRLLRRITEKWLLARGVVEEGTVATAKKLLHYTVMLMGLGVAIQTIGINLGALFAAGAVVAVALGFAMQNILQNFVSGVILLAERSITESDVLEVDGRIVRVMKMGTRATVARTRDEEEIIIPNSSLVQSSVTNYTLADSLYRIRAQVGVAYGSDMDQVLDVLRRAGGSVQERVKGRDPVVLLLEFGNSSVDFEVSIWAEDPWLARVTRSALNMAIWRHLKDEGITIAFPQLDVHFDDVDAGLASESVLPPKKARPDRSFD
ncbi:MAG: mechanosensitive ion channel [Gemmatimonadetes bacterium]|nr:mechanosensitive ion channel [Gemmatimonadota bacterium]